MNTPDTCPYCYAIISDTGHFCPGPDKESISWSKTKLELPTPPTTKELVEKLERLAEDAEESAGGRVSRGPILRATITALQQAQEDTKMLDALQFERWVDIRNNEDDWTDDSGRAAHSRVDLPSQRSGEGRTLRDAIRAAITPPTQTSSTGPLMGYTIDGEPYYGETVGGAGGCGAVPATAPAREEGEG